MTAHEKGENPKANIPEQSSAGAGKLESMVEKPTCFVIMPISDPDGYASGHFLRVYEDIFKPACKDAGFEPVRADEVSQTNLIMLDVLKKLVEVPMVLCDLSSRNPNVLFELGLRQAFDKPVVLVREVSESRLFDVASLRDVSYNRTMSYRDVLADRAKITQALKETVRASKDGDVNSLVRLLGLIQPASLPEVKEAEKDPLYQLVRAEISALRADLAAQRRQARSTLMNTFPPSRFDLNVNEAMLQIAATELERKIHQQAALLDEAIDLGELDQEHDEAIKDLLLHFYELAQQAETYEGRWTDRKYLLDLKQKIDGLEERRQYAISKRKS